MLALTLRPLVTMRPQSVVFVPQPRTRRLTVAESALYWACQRFQAYPDLVDEIVRADPTALLIAGSNGDLPFEAAAAAAENPDFTAPVQEKTVYMALAVDEYVLGGAAIDDDDDDDDEEEEVEEDDREAGNVDDVTAFQIRVRDAVDSFLRPAAPADRAGSSGFDVARAVGELDNAIDVVHVLFCRDPARDPARDRARDLLRENAQFRSAVMGDVVADLYRLNCMGRFGDGSASHQVELLASLQDSGTVESTFLHFREVAHNVLLPLGVRGEEGNEDGAARRWGN
jgi:hypothetical protein